MATLAEVEQMLLRAEQAFGALGAGVRSLDDDPEAPPDPDEGKEGELPGADGLPGGTIRALRLDADEGIKPPWHGIRAVAPDRIQRVTNPVRAGTHAYRFEVRPGDSPTSGERAELYTDPRGFIGNDDVWYCAWSTLFPEDWELTPDGGYQIFWQLHGVGDTLSPAVSFRTDTRGIVLRLRGGSDDRTKRDVVISPSLHRGKWNDFVVFGVAAADADRGRIAVWHRAVGDGWRKACDVHEATNHGHAQYARGGLYRAPSPKRNILFHDRLRFGNSIPEVAAAFWHGAE